MTAFRAYLQISRAQIQKSARALSSLSAFIIFLNFFFIYTSRSSPPAIFFSLSCPDSLAFSPNTSLSLRFFVKFFILFFCLFNRRESIHAQYRTLSRSSSPSLFYFSFNYNSSPFSLTQYFVFFFHL